MKPLINTIRNPWSPVLIIRELSYRIVSRFTWEVVKVSLVKAPRLCWKLQLMVPSEANLILKTVGINLITLENLWNWVTVIKGLQWISILKDYSKASKGIKILKLLIKTCLGLLKENHNFKVIKNLSQRNFRSFNNKWIRDSEEEQVHLKVKCVTANCSH